MFRKIRWIKIIKDFSKIVNVTEIYGICLAENKASEAVMKKCGFINVYSGIGLYQGADREIIKNVWKM